MKPATWQVNEPQKAWCPTEIALHLGALGDFTYAHNKSEQRKCLSDWTILAATRRGKMHAHEGTHREDAFGIEAGENFVIASVSDGAGAYEHSRIGSELTCREVNRRLRDFITERKQELFALEEEELRKTVGAAMAESVDGTCTFLQDLAAKINCEPKDLRCTLLIGLLLQTPKASVLLASHVGDGFPAGLDRDGKATRYGASDSGEFSGEVNCFIPDRDAPTKARNIMSLNPHKTEALLLCTDGVEDPFYPVEKTAGIIFQQLYCGVQTKLADFKSQETHGPIVGQSGAPQLLETWLSFEKQGENDDRTILLLHREPVTVDRSKII
jgi:serine/threonine protein phosphatase PrpC